MGLPGGAHHFLWAWKLPCARLYLFPQLVPEEGTMCTRRLDGVTVVPPTMRPRIPFDVSLFPELALLMAASPGVGGRLLPGSGGGSARTVQASVPPPSVPISPEAEMPFPWWSTGAFCTCSVNSPQKWLMCFCNMCFGMKAFRWGWPCTGGRVTWCCVPRGPPVPWGGPCSPAVCVERGSGPASRRRFH